MGEVRAETPGAKANGFPLGIVGVVTRRVKRLNPYRHARPCRAPYMFAGFYVFERADIYGARRAARGGW